MEGFTQHGGRLAAAMRRWPHAPRPWLDLSTGVNPVPYRAPRASAAARGRLPYLEETAALEAAAGAAFGVADPERIAATPGAEAALRLLPALLQVEAVFIPQPTYASHADAWAVAQVAEDEAAAAAVVLVNPNNPDGRIHSRASLLAMADRLAARRGWLVVDESFADALPSPSLAASGHPAVVVIRSFGKFYGLAGLRLGFVIAAPGLIRRLRGLLGDWPVSADALTAGLAAYPDEAWRERTRARLARQSARLDRALRRSGFDILGGTPLFRLTKAADAARRFTRLCEQGVLTRPFADAPDRLRFGLPRPALWPRLAAALDSLA